MERHLPFIPAKTPIKCKKLISRADLTLKMLSGNKKKDIFSRIQLYTLA